MKQKTCKVCRAEFTPNKPMAKVCSLECAKSLAISDRLKREKVALIKEKIETKKALEKFKKRGQWIAEAQTAFNLFIRERDKKAGYPCISSGKPLDWNGNAVDAGHYRSRGSAPHLRFDERNCHAQSKHDNRYLGGNIVCYRVGLIGRIGLEAVEALEADQTQRKYTIDDLNEIKREYTAKAKELRAAQ